MKIETRFIALTAVALAAWSTPARADMTLVDAATPPCPIIVNAKDNPLEGIAAKQLALYLKKISGKDFEVKAYAEPMPARAIIIGEHGNAPLTQLGSDGFIIKTKGEQLFIMGGGAQGTFYGVYDFLEKQLGCRFWSWNEEDVPQKSELKLGDLDVKEVPAFLIHDIMSKEAQNGTNYFVYKSRAKSTLQFTGNHTMYKLLTPAAKENPEFWPMNDKGVRAPNALHFNYIAPGIDQALADALSKVVEEKKGNLKDWIYFAGQGDWYGGLDQAEESKAIYKINGNSAPLVEMMNRTAAILDKKYPGIKVGTFAYMSTDSPPVKTEVAENVNIWLPRLRYGTTLSIEEAASEKNLDEKSRAKSQMIKRSIENWARLAPGRFYIWEYGALFSNFLVPWPTLRSMSENIKYYKKIGVTGVMIQSNYVSFGGDEAVLKNWIWSKLLWNPDQDINVLLKEFCDGYYGPASADIQTYINTIEDVVRVPQYRQTDEFGNGTVSSPEAKVRIAEASAEMKAAVERARTKTEGEANAKYRQRVNEIAVSQEAGVIWTTGTLVEKDGKLIRADIDKDNGGTYTHDRAMVLAKSTRGSSVSESGDFRSQVRNMIAANGGPLYTLKHGDVTVKVAPYQGFQRLWKVLLGEREVISNSYSMTYQGRYFEPVGTPTNDKVEIEGEMGYHNWDPYGYYLNKETFTQDEDGTLHWDTRYRRINRGAEHVTYISTAYPAGSMAIAQQYVIEYLDGEVWKPVPFDAPLLKLNAFPNFPEMQPIKGFKLRITTPDKKVVVYDNYDGAPILGVIAAYGRIPLFNSTNSLMVFLKTAAVATEAGKDVPIFQRTIKVEATG